MPRGVERDQAVQPGGRIAAGETLVGEVGRNGEPGAGRAESAAEDEPGAPPAVVRRREPRVERDERAEPRRRARPAGAVAGDVGRQPQPPGLRASKAAVAQRGVPAVGPRPGPRTVERESVAAQPRDVAELDDAIARAWILVAEVQRRDLERSHAGDRPEVGVERRETEALHILVGLPLVLHEPRRQTERGVAARGIAHPIDDRPEQAMIAAAGGELPHAGRGPQQIE